MQRRHRNAVEATVLATGRAGVYVCKEDVNFTQELQHGFTILRSQVDKLLWGITVRVEKC